MYFHRRRNIPAHAGKTAPTYTEKTLSAEHPRACGENVAMPAAWAVEAGTSPRTRGKHRRKNPPNPTGRNIPAHAGKTSGLFTIPNHFEEHPRARGENAFRGGRQYVADGTSPRTRGKQGIAVSRIDNARNIPAHAGKTSAHCSMRWGRREHPRARGENCRNAFCF